jgi:hypothetical protein
MLLIMHKDKFCWKTVKSSNHSQLDKKTKIAVNIELCEDYHTNTKGSEIFAGFPKPRILQGF